MRLSCFVGNYIDDCCFFLHIVSIHKYGCCSLEWVVMNPIFNGRYEVLEDRNWCRFNRLDHWSLFFFTGLFSFSFWRPCCDSIGGMACIYGICAHGLWNSSLLVVLQTVLRRMVCYHSDEVDICNQSGYSMGSLSIHFLEFIGDVFVCGGGEIRTHDTLRYTGFRNRRTRPTMRRLLCSPS